MLLIKKTLLVYIALFGLSLAVSCCAKHLDPKPDLKPALSLSRCAQGLTPNEIKEFCDETN